MTDKLILFVPGFGSVEMPLIDFDPKRKPLDMSVDFFAGKGVKIMIRYRIIHEPTGESFEVQGHSPFVCRKQADRECEKRGWNIWQVRSERV